ncbi:carbonic anhydrase 6-like [Aphidius gifuensis]|uniref:carbonic anhydrase 6-like n=1 Tax=Aphidius gifuensis TaxID=684658 RepID=UPI001CDC2DDB|nr:carbonic anhydrase 6-like [Aphidius gifuensis]
MDNMHNEEEWSFNNPEEWKNDFPKCNGSKQSPIDISSNLIQKKKSDFQLKWNNYDVLPKSMSIKNSGRTIQLNVKWYDNSSRPYVTSKILNDDYIFYHLHFRWGANDKEGSDHTLNGKSLSYSRYPLEVQMVHYKKQYKTMENSMNYPDGMMLLSSFYSTDIVGESIALENFRSDISKIKKVNDSKEIKVFPLSLFDVIKKENSWATYNGSFTEPDCAEVVTWILSLDIYSTTSKQDTK